MRLTLFFCSLLATSSLFAQTPPAGTELKNATLQERFQLMKSTSQTFQDYKVIKEVVLEREWKIFVDSIRFGRTRLKDAKAEGARLESELLKTQLTLKQKVASIAPTEYAASHINFAGIDFNKAAFTGLVLSIVAVLVLAVLLVVGRLKMVNSDMKQKTEAFDQLAHELEEYKHKALEKQTKLSRELQNERNRLQEMRGSKV